MEKHLAYGPCGRDAALEAAADEFLRECGESPPRLRPWTHEVAAWRRAVKAER